MTLHRLNFEHVSACPVCGSAQFAHVYTRNSSDLPAHYSRCASCGVMFLTPRMTDAQQVEYYQGLYRDIISSSTSGINPADLKRQQERARYQVGIVGAELTGVKTNLEIGCSAGYLMQALQEIGIASTGIELDRRYHQIEPACHFSVYSTVDEAPGGTFDLISLSHVVEHFNHPIEFLRGLFEKRAHPETKILVEVPNGEASGGAYLIHHSLAFTVDTLCGLFERLGYREQSLYLHGLGAPMNFYILALFGRQ